MPGGGTPALDPMNAPALVWAPGPSFAKAGATASAAIPAAASRVLPFIFLHPCCDFYQNALPLISRRFENYLASIKAQARGIDAPLFFRSVLLARIFSISISRDRRHDA
jgi:hypothetical protein